MNDDSFILAIELAKSNLVGYFKPEAVNIKYFIDIFEGISLMHKYHIIHCDIKPENLLIMIDDRIVLSDFGSVSLYSDKRIKKRVHIGTPNYRDYNLLITADNIEWSFEIDIWSLGCTLLDIFTGYYPYFRSEKSVTEYENGYDKRLLLSISRDIENKLFIPYPFLELSFNTKVRSLILKMLTINKYDRINIETALNYIK